ncbi:flavin monoamine oxidase family protein [Paenarthrobacter nicotinovorans]|uniref:flavin monoamine oxidase family protein n=1 Tax=Paenarthrobacter nicotinovorans TaxID=29320 RepID=UPI003D675D33
MSTDNTLDLAIVGAGPAGLRVAQQLRGTGAKIQVFEELSHIGGRTATQVVDGVTMNTGAMFVYRGTNTDKLCAELGIEYEPVEPRTFGIHINGTTVLGTEADDLANALPISPEAKQDMAHLVESLANAYSEHGADLADADYLSTISLSEFIGPIGDEARSIIWSAVAGACVGTPEELNAKYGLRYLASFLVRDSTNRGYVPNGMQSIFQGLYEQVTDIVSLGTSVEEVSPNEDGSWTLHYTKDGQAATVTAARVVIAVPGPQVERIVPSLPAWKKEAIAAVPTPSQVTLGAVVDSTDRPHWADLFYVVSLGTKFHGVTQPRTGDYFAAGDRNRTYFEMFRGRDTAEELHAQDDATVTAEWLEDFYKVFPDARGRVTGTYLKRWDNAFAYPRFDRQSYLADVRMPVGTMHFAGDYTSESAGSHGALTEAERVAADLRPGLER